MGYRLMATSRRRIKTSSQAALAAAIGFAMNATCSIVILNNDPFPEPGLELAGSFFIALAAYSGAACASSKQPEKQAARYARMCLVVIAVAVILGLMPAAAAYITSAAVFTERPLASVIAAAVSAIIGGLGAVIGYTGANGLQHSFQLQAEKKTNRK